MAKPSDIALVERAQTGDQVAFAELVTNTQALAVAAAYGWLGDMDLARDVAQEAFVDAFQHLTQLREPAAFAGWFRQIVIKHCDRVTRRPTPATTTLESLGEMPAPTVNPEIQVENQELHQRLRLAVDALPQKQRMVVALHYFAELTGAQAATFLDLPLSTVKQRLRSARTQLRQNSETLLEETLKAMQPLNTKTFSEEITFFIALRAGDTDEVRRLLKLHPKLAESVQQWDSDVVYKGVLPFANKATPLITAVERNDLAMQRLLLDAGADVNGQCHCHTGETPLWAAVLLNRFAHAKMLLESGADPNRVSSAGNTPLHVAAMRGMTPMVQLLLRYDADPNQLDEGQVVGVPWSTADDRANGQVRNAAQWAQANGHSELANIISQFSSDESGAAAGSATSETRIDESIVHTGIKALDLLAPLVRGSLTRFPFMAGVGMVVLLGELSQRFLSRPTGKVVWAGFTQPPFDLADWQADMSEFGLLHQLDVGLADYASSAEARRKAFAHGLETAEALRAGGHDVLTILLTAPGFEHDIEASLARLATPHTVGSITTIVVPPFPEQREVTPVVSAPFTGQLVLDRARAKRFLFPALDARFTTSHGLDKSLVGARHLALAQQTVEVINQYQAMDPDFAQLDSVTDQTERAAKLIRYLCQPFLITEPFTGRPGEQVSRADLLDSVEKILNS